MVIIFNKPSDCEFGEFIRYWKHRGSFWYIRFRKKAIFKSLFRYEGCGIGTQWSGWFKAASPRQLPPGFKSQYWTKSGITPRQHQGGLEPTSRHVERYIYKHIGRGVLPHPHGWANGTSRQTWGLTPPPPQVAKLPSYPGAVPRFCFGGGGWLETG